MPSIKINGDEAYEDLAQSILERAEEGKMTEDEFMRFVVVSLQTSNRRIKRSEDVLITTLNTFDKFPPLMWLIKRRPRSTIPFLVGLFSLLSGFFVSDIRMYVLGLLGFSGGELPENAPFIVISLTMAGFITSLIMRSTEKGFIEGEIEE